MKKPSKKVIKWILGIVLLGGIITLIGIFAEGLYYNYYVRPKQERENIAQRDSLRSDNVAIREACALNLIRKNHQIWNLFPEIESILNKSENPVLLYAAAKSYENYYDLNNHPQNYRNHRAAYKMAYYYMLAAEHGHHTAQAEFSRCLMNGFGTSANTTLAYEWARKSAAANDSVGIYALGMCKAKGYGTHYDPDSAVILLRQSAASGYERAQQNLMIELPNVPPVDYNAY